MEKVDLAKCIMPTELNNTDKNGVNSDESFKTKDLVFLDSIDEVKNLKYSGRIVSLTDYAMVNWAYKIKDRCSGTGKEGTSIYWLRSHNKEEIDVINDCNFFHVKPNWRGIGICPSLHLNINAIIEQKNKFSDFAKIETAKDRFGNSEIYHTIEFGEYPKTFADNYEELENLFQKNKISTTNKKYLGFYKDDESYIENLEYEYFGKRYVRVYSNAPYCPTKYQVSGNYFWVEVEPIKWVIKNWEDMPSSINPEGNGIAKYIDVKAEESIMGGIPFYPNEEDKNGILWQNSSVRGFLNSMNVANIRTNGNKEYIASKGGDFSSHGFLEDAFNLDKEKKRSLLIGNIEVMQRQKRMSRLEKINPDITPVESRRKMTDTEIIKSWIDAGQSVLLRGPSGIGKTERLKKLYPDLIYIKLTNNMFPEKVVGSMNLQTGQSIPPDFAKQALMACATDDERKLIKENIQNLYDLADTIYERSKNATGKTVIVLDELLNVKPAVQSLVYTLVLNKLVETGKGLKLPANTVVVATGNQKKYSVVAEDLAEPLEKRFDHILDMEPNVGEWLYEFAIPSKIHPAVIGYIMSKYLENMRSEKIKDMEYFYEEPEVGENHLDKNGCRGRTNDPRSWESISKTLYAFEKDLKNGKFVGKDVEALLRISISSKLREEWSEDFYDFYNHPTLTVEEVVENKYTKEDLPRDINEKFATVAGLLNATPEQVGECREFIQKYCDPEYLSLYDLYWAGKDEERMEKIVEIREMSKIQQVNKGELEK